MGSHHSPLQLWRHPIEHPGKPWICCWKPLTHSLGSQSLDQPTSLPTGQMTQKLHCRGNSSSTQTLMAGRIRWVSLPAYAQQTGPQIFCNPQLFCYRQNPFTNATKMQVWWLCHQDGGKQMLFKPCPDTFFQQKINIWENPSTIIVETWNLLELTIIVKIVTMEIIIGKILLYG